MFRIRNENKEITLTRKHELQRVQRISHDIKSYIKNVHTHIVLIHIEQYHTLHKHTVEKYLLSR